MGKTWLCERGLEMELNLFAFSE